MHESLSGSNAIAANRMTVEERLVEACAILARGLVRLHSRAAVEIARDAAPAQHQRESSLHIPVPQRGHAKPKPRRFA